MRLYCTVIVCRNSGNGCQQDENGKNIRGTGHMIFNWFKWEKDGKEIPKIHPAQKPVKVLEQLIQIFTDPGDVVIDPVLRIR